MNYDVMETEGFSFDNYINNRILKKDGKAVKTKKTGTTTFGLFIMEELSLQLTQVLLKETSLQTWIA